jgi:hypothetical protein
MVSLECNHELFIPLSELKIRPDYEAYIAGLKKCEFKTLFAEVEEEARKAGNLQGELF